MRCGRNHGGGRTEGEVEKKTFLVRTSSLVFRVEQAAEDGTEAEEPHLTKQAKHRIQRFNQKIPSANYVHGLHSEHKFCGLQVILKKTDVEYLSHITRR